MSKLKNDAKITALEEIQKEFSEKLIEQKDALITIENLGKNQFFEIHEIKKLPQRIQSDFVLYLIVMVTIPMIILIIIILILHFY